MAGGGHNLAAVDWHYFCLGCDLEPVHLIIATRVDMGNFRTFCEQGRKKKMSLVSSQTLSKGGESSLSGPQQHVAVQRSAIPLQEGKVTSPLGCK